MWQAIVNMVLQPGCMRGLLVDDALTTTGRPVSAHTPDAHIASLFLATDRT